MTKKKTTPQKPTPRRAHPSDKPTRFVRVRFDFVYALDREIDSLPLFFGAPADPVIQNGLKDIGEHFPGVTHLVPGVNWEVSLDRRAVTRRSHAKDLAAERAQATGSLAKPHRHRS